MLFFVGVVQVSPELKSFWIGSGFVISVLSMLVLAYQWRVKYTRMCADSVRYHLDLPLRIPVEPQLPLGQGLVSIGAALFTTYGDGEFSCKARKFVGALHALGAAYEKRLEDYPDNREVVLEARVQRFQSDFYDQATFFRNEFTRRLDKDRFESVRENKRVKDAMEGTLEGFNPIDQLAGYFEALLAEFDSMTRPIDEPMVDGVPSRVRLRPSGVILAMLSAYPFELAEKWKRVSVDGAIEIFRCPSTESAYGGFPNSAISCVTSENLRDWPDDFGDLSEEQIRQLSVGLVGDKRLGVEGWLKAPLKAPRPLRILSFPPDFPSLARPSFQLALANSDYLTVRAVTEISRIERSSGALHLSGIFPERWTTNQRVFSTRCVPYHISIQAIIVCQTTNDSFLLLTNTSKNRRAITAGWGATMATQMWGDERSSRKAPWWFEQTKGAIVPRDPQIGETHLAMTLRRGLENEFGITQLDLSHEPLLLLAALEEDMYFMTFVYVVRVKLALKEVYQRWQTASDYQHNGLLAAVQIGGSDSSSGDVRGPAQLARLLSSDDFHFGAHLLPEPVDDEALIGPWHVTSRLRIYALGMHLWPKEFSHLVEIECP
jgi:hypothetical protein